MTVASFIPEIWSAALLEPYTAGQIVIPTLTREYEGTATRGNVVHVNALGQINVQDYKAAGRTFNPEDLTTVDMPIAIDQEKVTAYRIDNVDRRQAAGSLDAATIAAGEALAEDAENYAVGMLKSGGKQVTVTAPTDYPSAHTVLAKLRTALGRKVPLAGRYAVVSPEFAELLLGPDSALVKVNEAGSENELRNGVIGRLLGFTILEHPALTGTEAVGYHGRAAAFISQIDESRAVPAQNAHADIVSHLLVYGAKVTRKDGVVVAKAG